MNCVELFSYDQNIIAVKNVRFMIGELNAETNCLCLTISFFQNSMLILHFGLTSYNTVKEAGWPTNNSNLPGTFICLAIYYYILLNFHDKYRNLIGLEAV